MWRESLGGAGSEDAGSEGETTEIFLCKVSNFQMNTKEWVYMLSLSRKQPCSFAAANTKTRATPEV